MTGAGPPPRPSSPDPAPRPGDGSTWNAPEPAAEPAAAPPTATSTRREAAPDAAAPTPTPPTSSGEDGARQAMVVCIANQKGGVGKTTTAVSLGAGLAQLGAQVLLVDLDPQGNATTGLGIRAGQGQPSSYQVLIDGLDVEDATEPTSVRGLHCIPSTIDLAGAEIELVPAFSRELRLRRGLEAVRDLYDVVLVDCPPSLGLLTVNGLSAADRLLVPIQCEYYALEGLGQLLHTLDLVGSSLNPGLELGGVVLTMYDARTRLSQQVVDDVREYFGDRVFHTVVPRTVRLSEAPGFGEPIVVFDPTSRGARAYARLADETARRFDLSLPHPDGDEPEAGGSPLDRLLGAFDASGDEAAPAPEPEEETAAEPEWAEPEPEPAAAEPAWATHDPEPAAPRGPEATDAREPTEADDAPEPTEADDAQRRAENDAEWRRRREERRRPRWFG